MEFWQFFNEFILTDESESSDDDVYGFIEAKNVKPRIKNYVETVVDQYSNADFKKNFRMERQTFDFILNLIANKISVSFGDMGRNTIDAKIQLLLAIWYFATPDSYRLLPPILCFLGKSTYRAGGMNIVIKGKQASRKEAPILVVAPHSTFFDGGIIYITGFPSIIVRRESGMNPYIGKLINFTQPVYVWREDPNSRQNTIKEIIDRATSDQDWPQVLIFPEGTCTNRSCLIRFKPGAFYPGVPIQPVCIRYPNKLDTVTWTWEGPGALKLLWLTLTQVTSSCEIEFLPVYRPNEEEKKDPKLFANNVRNVMARALGIPVSDYTYDDCRLMSKAKQMNLPHATDLVEVQKLRHKLGLDQCNIEDHLVESKMLRKEYSHVTCTQFAHYLNVPIVNPAVQQLFRLYDKDCTGLIDFREYLLGVLGISRSGSTLETFKLACKIYDHTGTGYLSLDDFTKALSHTLQMTVEEAEELFDQIVGGRSRHVTYDQFLNFAQKKAEFANLFGLSREEKQNRQNGTVHNNNNIKKTK